MGSSKCQLLPPRGRGGLGGLRGHVMAQSAGSTALAGGGRGSAGNAARPSGNGLLLARRQRHSRTEVRRARCRAPAPGQAGHGGCSPALPCHPSLPLPTARSALGPISAEQQQPRGWSVARHSCSAAAPAGERRARPSFPPYKGKAPSPAAPPQAFLARGQELCPCLASGASAVAPGVPCPAPAPARGTHGRPVLPSPSRPQPGPYLCRGLHRVLDPAAQPVGAATVRLVGRGDVGRRELVAEVDGLVVGGGGEVHGGRGAIPVHFGEGAVALRAAGGGGVQGGGAIPAAAL